MVWGYCVVGVMIMVLKINAVEKKEIVLDGRNQPSSVKIVLKIWISQKMVVPLHYQNIAGWSSGSSLGS